MRKRETLGIIGRSGCGKTTLLKLIMGLVKPDGGSVVSEGRLGFVAQDPYASLDSSMSIYKIIAEPLIFTGQRRTFQGCREEVEKRMAQVRLPMDVYGRRFPAQLSGGERQRVSIARALIRQPDFLIMDEPTSMLDQEIKEDIMELIHGIARTNEFGFLLVTHDIRASVRICERIIVMSQGKIVEEGKTNQILKAPRHQTTRELIEVAEDVKEYWKKFYG